MTKARPAIERLMERVTFAPSTLATDCWLSGRHRSKGGYSRIQVDGQTMYAHRFSYEYHVGPIPDGLTIDHLCRVRHCVNPEHLEPVTGAENVQRAFRGVAGQDTCGKGHSMADAYRTAKRRNCRTCQRLRQRDYMRRQRA